MKLKIDLDEVWPVYELSIPENEEDSNCDLPSEFYQSYLLLIETYERIQRILKEHHENRK